MSELFDLMADAVLVADERGRYVEANDAASKLLGYSKEELRERSIGDLVVADGGRTTSEFARFLAEGHWRGELDLRCKDGTTVRVDARATPLGDTGAGRRYVSVIREIGAQSWEGLAPSSATLAAIVQSSDDAIIGKDLDGIIRSWNPGATKIYGYLPEEVIGRPIWILAPDRVDEFKGIMERLRRGEHIDHTVTKRQRKDGTVIDVSLTISPIADQTGRLVGASTIARDITERRHAEDALRAAQELLDVITAGAGDGITIQDAGGNVIYVNDAAARFSGFASPEEMMAAPYSKVFERFELSDETGAPVALSDLPGRRALRGEEEPEIVLKVRDRTDGTTAWRVVGARPVLDERGEVRYAVNVLTDITAQRIAEYRFHRLFEASIIGIIMVDETTILEANDAFLEMVGYDREDLRAHRLRWPEMTPPEWQAADERAWKQVYASGVIPPFEKEFVRRDGTRVPVILAAVMLQATPYEAVCFVLDASDRKRAEQERALLLEQEQLARAEAESAREQLAFLLRASGLLSRSLDYEQTLSQVARLVVPRLADWASIQIIEESGTLKQLTIAHVDPAKVEMAEELSRRFPQDLSSPYGVPNVIRTGKPEVIPEISEAMLEEIQLDEELKGILRDLRIRSTMIVPLAARGRVFGAITLVWAESGRSYSEEDLPLVEELASRASLAIDNARLFHERDHIAEALQRSLLPPELPAIRGLDLAARYRASGAGNEVGGDFYDVFENGEGNWSLVIGDVCGKGPEAAALMGIARYTVRTASMQERRPSNVLTILNEGILRQSSDGRFCTVCYVRMHVRDDGVRLTVCAGGHPLPLILRADGSVEQAGVPGSLIGVLEDPELTDLAAELGPRDALVLYTDGVTDEQTADGEFGEARLISVLASCAGKNAEEIARTIEEAVMEFAPGAPRDDIAILVARVEP